MRHRTRSRAAWSALTWPAVFSLCVFALALGLLMAPSQSIAQATEALDRQTETGNLDADLDHANSGYSQGEPAGSEGVMQRTSDCRGSISARVLSATVPACKTTDVVVDVAPECPVCPGGVHAIFVQLSEARENRWQNEQARQVLDIVEEFVDDNDVGPVRMAVVHYDASDARTVQRLTDDFSRVRSRLNQPGTGYIAQADAERAAREAVRQLNDARRESEADEDDLCEIVVMFAHVKAHDAHADNLRRAGRTIKRETRNFLVGCPIEPGAWYCDGPEPEMPHSRREFAPYSDTNLPNVARGFVRDWERGAGLRTVQVSQKLPPGLLFLDGSASLTPTQITVDPTHGTEVLWAWDEELTRSRTFTYTVQPMRTGEWEIESALLVTDTLGLQRQVTPEELPRIQADVEDCPEGTPTVTPPPPTSTPTATATATSSPTATPTRGVYTIYLPIALGEGCETRRQHGDIVLVLDMSTSMRRITPAGRPKVEAVLDAAQVFVDAMRFEPDDNGDFDQVAIVGFNRNAWIEQPLTNNATELADAILSLPDKMQEYTRLDLAVLRGAEALESENRRKQNTGVIVMLTDGLPNQVPYAEDGTMETTVLRAAEEAQASALVYTVGVGKPDADDIIDRINPALLRQVASDPDYYYETPDPEALVGIYSEIAVSIGCPPGRHDWTEPWP